MQIGLPNLIQRREMSKSKNYIKHTPNSVKANAATDLFLYPETSKILDQKS